MVSLRPFFLFLGLGIGFSTAIARPVTATAAETSKGDATAARVVTAKEATIFKRYFERSGLLKKNQKVKRLEPGNAFQIFRAACRDGDDLYVLSFDEELDLQLPKGKSLAEFYPIGTGGAWSPVFKHDPKSQYFQFVGASTHRWPIQVVNDIAGRKTCPDIEVGIHGSYCGKAGVEPCSGRLVYDDLLGYHLDLDQHARGG